MAVEDSQVVLELFSQSPLAVVYSSVGIAYGLAQSATDMGLCHSLSIRQSQHVVAGVKSQDSLLPGEVVG